MAHSLFFFLQLKCGRESAAAIFRMPEIFADTDGTIMPRETDAFHQFKLNLMRVTLKKCCFPPSSFWQSHLAQGGTTDIRLQRRFCGEKRSGLDPNTTYSSQIPGMKIQLHLFYWLPLSSVICYDMLWFANVFVHLLETLTPNLLTPTVLKWLKTHDRYSFWHHMRFVTCA